MGGVADNNDNYPCCEGMTKKSDFNRRDIVCPVRDHTLEDKAIKKALGPDHAQDDDVPTPASLGIRAVQVYT